MTLLFVYTILMAAFNMANGIFTYKIYKHLSLEINMSKVKKGFKKVKAMESIDSQEKDGDSLGANEEFDGTFSNSFSDRELSFIKAAEDSTKFFSQVLKSGDAVQILPAPGEGLSYVVGKDLNLTIVKPEEPNSSIINDGNVNIPIITDDDVIPEGESSMLSRLIYLSDFLNEKYKASLFLKEEEWENMKWETINETYCLITVDLPRKQAELIRKYFRRLDTTYVKNDGTYYSKITKGDLAKEIIEDLIQIYPWNDLDKDRVRINWEEFRKPDEDEHRTAQANPSEKAGDINSGVYGDKLKYAIGNLSKSVEKLNEILSGK
jgi:hypothetical protein